MNTVNIPAGPRRLRIANSTATPEPKVNFRFARLTA